MDQPCSKQQVKNHVNAVWLQEYESMLTLKTVQRYDKIVPKVNNKLNMHSGGAYWIKARGGGLLIGERSNTLCGRCTTNVVETLEHFLWECTGNHIQPIHTKLDTIWKKIPPDHFTGTKSQCFRQASLEQWQEATTSILRDDVDGHLLQLTGQTIEAAWKTRPEVIAYNMKQALPKTKRIFPPITN